ncbi:MAG: TonB-dependent receptor plug domain-containing protein, partial [Prevotellaceae bacterium]|nr:TonB-dependent receptor plug domain-containing protein [Prevotellaceae bacterium]
MQCLLLSLLLCAVLPLSLRAQNLNVSGTVRDGNSDPVAGASVVVKGATTGATTDANGSYTINAPADATLVFSFLGLSTVEEAVAGRGRIDVVLDESNQSLDEVVVVGYGTMRKRDVTGSISTTKGSDIVKIQSFNALEGLRGKAAGVNIFSNTGQPGGELRVIIRGIATINASANPLYVVDGVVMSDFHLVNPNDIESIEVLKDASSAAIYGARGANGVILV